MVSCLTDLNSIPTLAPWSRPAVLPHEKTPSDQRCCPSPRPPPHCCQKRMALASAGCHSPARCALWAPPLLKADVPFCKECFRRRNLPLRPCSLRGKSGPEGHSINKIFHPKCLGHKGVISTIMSPVCSGDVICFALYVTQSWDYELICHLWHTNAWCACSAGPSSTLLAAILPTF